MKSQSLCLGILVALLSHGQLFSQTHAQSFSIDAAVNKENDGTLTIIANNPRPLWQALESIKRRYGWTVDYEDPLYGKEQMVSGPGAIRVLKGGAFTAHIREPINSTASEEQRVLSDVVNQFNQQSDIKYRVKVMSDYRYDISPVSGSLMDQAVSIDSESRSLREEIDAVLVSLSKTTGISAVQGGLMMNAMEHTQVSLQHSKNVPLRQLFNEILDHAPREMTWLLTYEPNGGYFAIGVQPTQEWTPSASGKTIAKTFVNPHLTPISN